MSGLFSRLTAFLKSCYAWDKPFLRTVLTLALPIVAQQLISSSLHIVDGLMVSALGDAAYSAVTQANRVTFMFRLFAFGISTGGSIYLSQYWGAKDLLHMRNSLGVSLFFVLIVSFIFTGLGFFAPSMMVSLFLQPGESFDLAVQYLRIVCFSYVFVSIEMVYAASLKAGEKTWMPMVASFAGILTNTVLNYLFIFGCAPLGLRAMGVEGAAIATVIASAVSATLCIIFSYVFKQPSGCALGDLIPREKAFLKKFVKTVLPVILNEGLWGIGETIYSVYYGLMGDVAVSAMGICSTINELVWVSIWSLSGTAAIVVGKSLGAGERDKAYLEAKRLLAGGMLLGVVLGLALIALRGSFIGLFSGLSDEVHAKSYLILLIGACTIWYQAFSSMNVVGILRSGGDTVFSMVLDAGSLWVFGVPIAGIAALVLHWPLEWVYATTQIEGFVKMLIGMPHFKSRKWMHVLTDKGEQV